MPSMQQSEIGGIIKALRREYAGTGRFVVGYSGYEPFVTPNGTRPKAALLLRFFEALAKDVGRDIKYVRTTWAEFPRKIQQRQLDTMLEPILPRKKFIVIPYMDMVCNVLVVPELSFWYVAGIAGHFEGITERLMTNELDEDQYNIEIAQMLRTIAALSGNKIGVSAGVLEEQILEDFGIDTIPLPPEDIVKNIVDSVRDGVFFLADNHSAKIAQTILADENFRTRLVHLFQTSDVCRAQCGFAVNTANTALAHYFLYKCKFELPEIHKQLSECQEQTLFDGSEFRLLDSSEVRDVPITRYSLREMLPAWKQRQRFLSRSVPLLTENSQQPLVLSGSFDLQAFINDIRDYWGASRQADRNTHIALAVLHGLAELTVPREDISMKIQQFFLKQFELIKTGSADASQIENEARNVGLQVVDPQEKAIAIAAYFGVVEKVNADWARVILLDEQERRILDDRKVPLNWLPSQYRSEGAGVAWVERQYPSGPKGRFEPASTGEE
jgi:hypothetical protein